MNKSLMGNPLLEKFLKPKNEVNVVRTLYLVMKIISGYNVLFGEEWEEEYSFWKFKVKKKVIKKGIPIPALQEIIKCMEWEAREQNKSMRRR